MPVRTTWRVNDSDPLYIVGCPVGLPLKHAGKAVVRDNSPKAYFIANLDAYGGNSGSPVFSADDQQQVEGILVRGAPDFERHPSGCLLSKVCPDTGCEGEHVLRIRQIPGELFQ